MTQPLVSLVPSYPFHEQEVLYEYQLEYIRRLTPVLEDLGVRYLRDDPLRKGRDAEQPHEWGLGWKRHGDKRHRTGITFDGFNYVDGDRREGATQIQHLGGNREGWSEIYKKSDVDIGVVVDEELSLLDETYTEDRVSASFEVTSKTTSEANAGVKAGPINAGASVTNETTVSAGSEFNNVDSAKNTSTWTHRVQRSFTAPKGRELIATVDVGKVKAITPYEQDGYINHSTIIDCYDWVEERAPYLKDGKDTKHNVIVWDNHADALAFLRGQLRAEYPNMVNFMAECSRESRQFVRWLEDVEERRVTLFRQDVNVYERAGQVRVRFTDTGEELEGGVRDDA